VKSEAQLVMEFDWLAPLLPLKKQLTQLSTTSYVSKVKAMDPEFNVAAQDITPFKVNGKRDCLHLKRLKQTVLNWP